MWVGLDAGRARPAQRSLGVALEQLQTSPAGCYYSGTLRISKFIDNGGSSLQRGQRLLRASRELLREYDAYGSISRSP